MCTDTGVHRNYSFLPPYGASDKAPSCWIINQLLQGRVNLKKSNQLKNNNQFVRGGSPRLRGNIGYCHLVVEQVGGSHHRSPESPCGTLRMLHAVMQATPAAVAGQGAHLPHEAMLVYVGMCHAKYGGWNVRVRAAQV